MLYYLSNEGVQAFDGSLPVTVSQALGEEEIQRGSGRRVAREVLSLGAG